VGEVKRSLVLENIYSSGLTNESLSCVEWRRTEIIYELLSSEFSIPSIPDGKDGKNNMVISFLFR